MKLIIRFLSLLLKITFNRIFLFILIFVLLVFDFKLIGFNQNNDFVFITFDQLNTPDELSYYNNPFSFFGSDYEYILCKIEDNRVQLTNISLDELSLIQDNVSVHRQLFTLYHYLAFILITIFFPFKLFRRKKNQDRFRDDNEKKD